jgi:3',5'-cyclic AMP phosphodiesterase CpdA
MSGDVAGRSDTEDGDRGRPDDGAERGGPVMARFAAPRAPARTRLGVVADPHLTPTESGTWKVFHRTEERLRTAVDVLNDLDVDATVLLGDLTREGEPAEFECVEAVLARLEAPCYAVPGNHDVPKAWDDHESPPVETFAERFAPGLPFHRRIGGVDVVGLDSAGGAGLRGTIEGELSAADLAWLDRTLEDADAPVVALHHNLTHADEHTGTFPKAHEYHLRNDDELSRLLARHGDALVCSGHLHWPAVGRRGRTRELLAPAVCSFPQAAALLDVGPGGTTVRFVPLSGARGMAEAYTLAAAGNAHGQAIAAHADDGFDLPLVDEARRRPSADPAGDAVGPRGD